MSDRVKGVVSFVNDNPWTDRRSGEKITLYSFKIEGDDDTWYRTGTTEPPFEKGASVSFTVGKNNNVDLDSIEVLEASVKKAPKVYGSKGGAKSSGGGQSREGYWDAKEQRDLARDERYQTVDIPRMTFCTAQDAAVALVTAALTHGCLPKIDSAAKNGKLTALLAYTDELTDRLFKQRMAANVDSEAGEKQEEDDADSSDSRVSYDD